MACLFRCAGANAPRNTSSFMLAYFMLAYEQKQLYASLQQAKWQTYQTGNCFMRYPVHTHMFPR
jgi:hypothetical protein